MARRFMMTVVTAALAAAMGWVPVASAHPAHPPVVGQRILANGTGPAVSAP